MITADKNTYTLSIELNKIANNIAVIPMRNGIGLIFDDMNDYELKTYAGITSYAYNKIIQEMTTRGLLKND